MAKIARHIWDEEMSQRKKAEYLDSLWDSEDDDLLRLFFTRKLYFQRQLDIELVKIHNPDAYTKESNIRYGERPLKDMTLWQIRNNNPEYEKLLRDQVFENSKTADGQYHCDGCGLTSKNRLPFHVDHIVPMNNGGKSEPENLQILCRSCNIHKGDK